VAKNLIQLLTRQSKPGGAPSPIIMEHPLVLAPEEETVERAEALLIDDAQEMPSSPLQVLANSIQKASQDLHQLDEIRLRLESLRAPIAVEFENRVVDNNRLAQLTSELRTARARLAEAEAAAQRGGERGRDLDMQVVTLSGELDRTRVSLAAAAESLERLRPEHQEALAHIDELRTRDIAYSSEVFDLKTDKEYLSRQLEVAETARANGEALLARTREVQAEMESRAEGALKRLEQSTAENISLERSISELKVITAGEQERAAELSTQLAGSRAEARLSQETLKQQTEASRQEIKELRTKLEEAASRAKRMQQLHTELSTNQTAMLDDKSRLQRDQASLQAENRQQSQRIEVLEGWLADWRRRFGDVDAARLVAVDRSEELSVALAQSDANGKRLEVTSEQKSNELEEARRANDAEQNRMRSEIGELRSSLSQSRAELKMMRASLAAKA
jgi:chromosome segregation ATPase